MLRLTFISDTHDRHKQVTNKLPGGDFLFHSGDISMSGSESEVRRFLKWFDSIPGYTHKVFIAGNHDWLFQRNLSKALKLVAEYKYITYLQDQSFEAEGVKIYGLPWTPYFHNWAFNVWRNSDAMEKVWSFVPEDVDILLSHGPPFGKNDKVVSPSRVSEPLGSEVHWLRVQQVMPKINAYGHVHTGYGWSFDKGLNTHFINCSVVNEGYYVVNAPMHVEWNKETNKIKFL